MDQFIKRTRVVEANDSETESEDDNVDIGGGNVDNNYQSQLDLETETENTIVTDIIDEEVEEDNVQSQ